MMLNIIKQFLISKKADIVVQAPSRINLINPLDAVEGDYWMPSVAINGFKNPLCSFVYIKKVDSNPKSKKYQYFNQKIHKINENIIIFEKKRLLNSFKNDNNLVDASIYRFSETHPDFWKKFSKDEIEIGFLTTIPRQSGLGGSASIIVSILYALAKYFKLYNIIDGNISINKDIIAEMATRVEDSDLGITAGYSDRYLISRGGLAFCSYFGKISHAEIGDEPLAVYDRMDETYEIDKLPIIVCHSGVKHHSGSIHSKLRELYLQYRKDIQELYRELALISWKSRYAIMNRDWKTLGSYFKMNTDIMNKVMKKAGFKHGIGSANNILIDLIKNHPDVYAAKLTGAGGGGSVFALTRPSKIELVLRDWKNSLKELINNLDQFNSKYPYCSEEIRMGLQSAKFYRVRIDKNGVKEIL